MAETGETVVQPRAGKDKRAFRKEVEERRALAGTHDKVCCHCYRLPLFLIWKHCHIRCVTDPKAAAKMKRATSSSSIFLLTIQVPV